MIAGDNNFVVNSNHGTLVYKQAGPQSQAAGDGAKAAPGAALLFGARAGAG